MKVGLMDIKTSPKLLLPRHLLTVNFCSENPGISAGTEVTRCKSTNVEEVWQNQEGRRSSLLEAGGIGDFTAIFSKMAGLLCYRSLHTVRPHIPLIHFPKRFPLGKCLGYNI
jgi:hypothetical protein